MVIRGIFYGIGMLGLVSFMHAAEDDFDEYEEIEEWEFTGFQEGERITLSEENMLDKERVARSFPFTYSLHFQSIDFTDQKYGYGNILCLEKGKMIFVASEEKQEIFPGAEVIFYEHQETDDQDADDEDSDDVLFVLDKEGFATKFPASHFASLKQGSPIKRELVYKDEDTYVFDDGFKLLRTPALQNEITVGEWRFDETNRCRYKLVSASPLHIHVEVEDGEITSICDLVDFEGLQFSCHVTGLEGNGEIMLGVKFSKELRDGLILDDLQEGDIVYCYPFTFANVEMLDIEPTLLDLLKNRLVFIEVR